jgi:hypothetical protein
MSHAKPDGPVWFEVFSWALYFTAQAPSGTEDAVRVRVPSTPTPAAWPNCAARLSACCFPPSCAGSWPRPAANGLGYIFSSHPLRNTGLTNLLASALLVKRRFLLSQSSFPGTCKAMAVRASHSA